MFVNHLTARSDPLPLQCSRSVTVGDTGEGEWRDGDLRGGVTANGDKDLTVEGRLWNDSSLGESSSLLFKSAQLLRQLPACVYGRTGTRTRGTHKLYTAHGKETVLCNNNMDT